MNALRSEIGLVVRALPFVTRAERRMLTAKLGRLVNLPVVCEEVTWTPGPVDWPEPFDFSCTIPEFKNALKRIHPEWFKL